MKFQRLSGQIPDDVNDEDSENGNVNLPG